MKSFTKRLCNFSLQSAKIIILALSLLLFGTAFFTSSYAYMDTQQMIFAWDNLLLSLISIIASLGLIFLLTNLSYKQKYIKHSLLIFVMILYALSTLILIVFNKSVPGADPMTVFRISEQFATGHMIAIHPTDSYLSYYPHQIGLTAYYEILLRIWNLVPGDVIGYHFIKIVNLIWTEILIVCFYKIIEILFKKNSYQIIYLFLMMINLPLLMFTTFIYGEVPSIALFSVGLLFLLKLIKKVAATNKSRIASIVISTLCFTLSVALRKNMLVIMIAVFIALFFTALLEKRYWLLLLDVAFIGTCLFITPGIQILYELRAGNYLNDGVPALTYFAMGMQYADRGNGWYNGYNFTTYENSGLDAALASKTAAEYISSRLDYFSQNLGECFKFYFDKFQVQWCDGTYASLQATLATFGGRRPFFENLYSYNGFGHVIFIFICNVFQNLLYLGNCIFCIVTMKQKDKKYSFPHYLCLIGVLGIFLFHTIWEANSRYIFHSSILLLPTAAYGLGFLLSAVQNIKKVKRK